MKHRQLIASRAAAFIALECLLGSIALPVTANQVQKSPEAMTAVELFKSAAKFAKSGKSAFDAGNRAVACGNYRLVIHFGDHGLNKLTPDQWVKLYRRNLATDLLNSSQRVKDFVEKYCQGGIGLDYFFWAVMPTLPQLIRVPDQPQNRLAASRPAEQPVDVECTPAGSLRCQLEALEKVGPGTRAAEAVLPTAQNASPLRPAPGLATLLTIEQPQPPVALRPPPPVQEAAPLRPAPSAGNRNSQSTPARSAQSIEPQPMRFDQSLDELVRQGVVSPAERQRIRSGASVEQSPEQQQACRDGGLSEEECTSGVVVRWGPKHPQAPLHSPASDGLPSHTPTSKPLSSRERALLQQIRSNAQVSQWRIFGQCNYDWIGWKLQSNGIRTTAAYCGDASKRWTVGVSCERLLVAVHTTDSGWSTWERPAGPDNKVRQGEDEMVAALCANVGARSR